jgi:hypothetical protein
MGPLDPWQAEVLVSDHKRILVNCHRQSGKSTVGALKALHRALYRPGSLALIFSPSLRQSREVLLKSITTYHAIGKPVLAEAENQLSLILENRSRIIALPGSASTVRGYSGVDLIVIDESAFVADELIAAVSPMLAVSQGDLIAFSTPHGKRGWWWDAWENGGSNWKRVTASADKCPRIAKAWLREERLRVGERVFMQEYMCRFVEVVDQAFSAEQVRDAFDRTLEPLRFDEMPEA